MLIILPSDVSSKSFKLPTEAIRGYEISACVQAISSIGSAYNSEDVYGGEAHINTLPSKPEVSS